MMEATFKAKEGDREEQLRKLKSRLANHKANLLKFDHQRFVTGELEADSYTRLSVIPRLKSKAKARYGGFKAERYCF